MRPKNISRWSLFVEEGANHPPPGSLHTLSAIATEDASTSAAIFCRVKRLLDREGRLTDGYTCRVEIDTSSLVVRYLDRIYRENGGIVVLYKYSDVI